MFKDRLRAARCDSELRNHLMGHKWTEPPYGFGWPLAMKAEILNRIALKPPGSV